MQRYQIHIRPKFDRRQETRPTLQFRTLRSKTEQRIQWSPKDPMADEWTIDSIELPCADGVLFADLFADTQSILSSQVTLECRRFLATAAIVQPNVWTSSTDMVDRNVKFDIQVRPVSASKATLCGSLDEGKATDLLQRVFKMCHSSNSRFGKIEWLDPTLQTFNTSYIEAIFSPVSPMKRPVPGWMDLLHLTTAANTSMAFYQHALTLACRRMAIDPVQVVKHNSRTLDIEIVCYAAAWIARRSVYVHDTVLLASGACADVDHYGFTRLVDRPEQAGDDCESHSKETYLFLLDFQRQTCRGPAWMQRLHQTLRSYQIYQITGGIRGSGSRTVPADEKARNVLLNRSAFAGLQTRSMPNQRLSARSSTASTPSGGAFSSSSSSSRVSCHSWLALVPKKTNELWVQRGRQWIMRQKGVKATCASHEFKDAEDAADPVVFVESTEYTTSAPIVFSDEDERVRFCTAFGQYQHAEAFRCKVPWTVLQGLDRYISASTAVSCTPCSQCNAREFLFGSIDTNGDALQGGVACNNLFDPAARRGGPSSPVALFPLYAPTEQDMQDAKEVLEWFPPIFAVPHDEKASTTGGRGGSVTPSQRVYARPEEWRKYKSSFADWVAKKGWTFEAREYVEWRGCTGIEIDVVVCKAR